MLTVIYIGASRLCIGEKTNLWYGFQWLWQIFLCVPDMYFQFSSLIVYFSRFSSFTVVKRLYGVLLASTITALLWCSNNNLWYNFDFTAALHKFRQENGFVPANIIVYRDGVGDGQLEYVQRYEIGQMLQCFNTMQVQWVLTSAVISCFCLCWKAALWLQCSKSLVNYAIYLTNFLKLFTIFQLAALNLNEVLRVFEIQILLMRSRSRQTYCSFVNDLSERLYWCHAGLTLSQWFRCEFCNGTLLGLVSEPY